MRILFSEYSIHDLVRFRGELIKEMLQAGHEVIGTSANYEDETKTRLTELGVDCYNVVSHKKKPGRKLLNRAWYRVNLFLHYIMVYKVIKPDISIVCLPKASILSSIAAILCHINQRNIIITGLELCFYRKGIKNTISRLCYRILYKGIINKCQTVFFLNHDDYYRFTYLRMPVKEKSCILQGSGVDMNYFAFKPMPDTDVVCMAASMIRRKGVGEFIAAAKIVRHKYPKVRFLLIGKTSDNHPDKFPEQEINQAAEQGHIYYCDYVKDIRPYLEVCTIYVLPSYHEGNLGSIIEAEAVGRPIITTTAPGCRESVISGYNGFLVQPKDVKTLAEKIILLLENEEMKLRMAQNSYLLCKERFDSKKVNRVILEKLKLIETTEDIQ